MRTPIIEGTVIQGLRGLFDEEHEAQVFLNDLIRTYMEAGVTTLGQLRAALDKGDMRAVGAHAHKLKGLSRNIGAARLGNLCAVLEDGARDAVPAATVRALSAKLEDEYASCCGELKRTYYTAG